MCGLPTETDEDVLQIADLAKKVIADRAARSTGSRDIRCTVSIGGFVPKPHTPFQWAAPARPRDDRRAARQAAGRDPRRTRGYAKAIGFRYHDGKPGIVEGLLSRGDRRVGAVIQARVGGRRPLRRLERALLVRPLDALRRRALADEPVDVDWYTTREREYAEVLPWDHLDSGLDKDWLWEDWQDALTERRGRGLPLDAVLRLRRLPADGHRDPGRARPGRRCSR